MINRFKQLLLRLHKDDAGAMFVEKILILALISVPILIVLYIFRGKIEGWFTDQQNTLTQDMSNQGQNP